MRTQSTSRLPTRLLWPPIVLLLVGLLLTLGATVTMAETSSMRASLRFAGDVAETRGAIEQRVRVHVSLLQGVAGHFASGGSYERRAFRRYVEQLDLPNSYPGVQGIGFSARVPQEERAAFEAAVRSWGDPSFRIWPDDDENELHTIILLEPLDERNRRAIGFNMFSEPTRREAMTRARNSGLPAASGIVTLVQELDSQQQPGFLIYVPVYTDGALPTGLALRREELLGFAYSPFRAGDLLRGIFSERASTQIAFTIYDGELADSSRLLHRSPHFGGPNYSPALRSTETIDVAGRPWTIVYSSQPAFDAAGDAFLAPVAAVVGTLISLVVFAVAWAQARARHEAEQAVRARETFLSVASHELKTPLTSLYGNAQLLQRRAGRNPAFGERERTNVQVIVEQSRRLTRLIDDLLDHSRLQEGRLIITREQIDLAALVCRVADDLRPGLSIHHLQLSLPEGPVPVLGDEIRLDQVLVNLISNAVKYSPAGGPVQIRLLRGSAWATVSVTDRGIGIPRAALPELFSPFYRAQNAIRRQIGGMGIGLYVVRELVELHGGTLSVESEEGVGSTFTVALPLAPAMAESTLASHQSDPPLHQRR